VDSTGLAAIWNNEPTASQQFIVAQDHGQVTAGIHQGKPQPGMHTVCLFDDAAHRGPTLQSDGQAE
jgi:hypothetical protein